MPEPRQGSEPLMRHWFEHNGERLFLETVFWRVRTGSPWRDLPPAFGQWNSQFRRFRRWAKSGVFENLFKAMSEDVDLEYALIRSRSITA